MLPVDRLRVCYCLTNSVQWCSFRNDSSFRSRRHYSVTPKILRWQPFDGQLTWEDRSTCARPQTYNSQWLIRYTSDPPTSVSSLLSHLQDSVHMTDASWSQWDLKSSNFSLYNFEALNLEIMQVYYNYAASGSEQIMTTAVEIFLLKLQWASCCCWRKHQMIIGDFGVYPPGTMTVCTESDGNSSDSNCDIFNLDQSAELTIISIHRAMTLTPATTTISALTVLPPSLMHKIEPHFQAHYADFSS